MAFYKKRKLIIPLVEAITFKEFVQYGIEHCENLVDGQPWSFHYKGFPVTQEHENKFLIPNLINGIGVCSFTPEDVLVKHEDGKIYSFNKEVFNRIYELYNEDKK